MPDERFALPEVAQLRKIEGRTGHTRPEKGGLPISSTRGHWRFERADCDPWIEGQLAVPWDGEPK